MRTRFFTGLLVAAFLSVAAGASVAYYQTAGDPAQTFNSARIKALLRPPSLTPLAVPDAIRSASPQTLRFYLYNPQLMVYAALALGGVLCFVMALGRAVKLAWAGAPVERLQQRHAIDNSRLKSGARAVSSESRYGLKGRLTQWFGAIAALLSIASFLSVYSSLSLLLHRHGIEHGRAIANNLAESVAAQLASANDAQLRQLLSSLWSRNGLAYVLVFDGNRVPVAYAGPEVSGVADAVLNGLTVDGQGQRITYFRNRVAYDLLARADNRTLGTPGTVQVGVWRARIEDQVRKVLVVIAILLVAVTYGAILGARRLFARLTRPLEELAASAEALSRGDLETPIAIPPSGPMAQLGAALESVRTALKPVISRLKAELDVPARFTVLGALARDFGAEPSKKTSD